MELNGNDGTEDDDARLVAFLDGELDEAARQTLEARLAAEPDLRDRLALLRAGDPPFREAFAPLLDAAPVERLRRFLPSGDGREVERRGGARFGGMAAAAAVVAVVLLCAGVAIGRFWQADLASTREDWREAVAEYMNLYTADTFATTPVGNEAGLAALGQKIGLDLDPARVALPDLQFKGAQIFRFEGAPLAQLGYIDPASGPVLFCVIADSEPDASVTSSRRRAFSVASWARGGRGYMLIGRLPPERIAALAATLERRF